MKRFVSIAASIALAMSLLLLSGCSLSTLKPEGTGPAPELTPKTSATAKAGVLKVGIDSSSAPFAGNDSSGKLVGIDVDIAAAIAEQLGCSVEFVNVASDEADTALAAGTVDIVMNVGSKDFAPTSVTTVGPYLTDGPAFFATKATASSSASATGKVAKIPDGSTIAAQKDSVSEYQVQSAYPALTLTSTSTLSEAFNSLEQGKVTYAAADAIVGAYIATGHDDIAFVSAIATTSGIYVGVPQKNTQLAADVDGAVKAIQQNGVLNLCLAKWIGTPLTLPSPLDAPTYVSTGNLSTTTQARTV